MLSVDLLESRCLLSISTVEFRFDDDHADSWTVSWADADAQPSTTYEIWLDLNATENVRIPKVVHESNVVATNSEYRSHQRLSPGNYTAYLRSHTSDVTSSWVGHSFQVDDDADESTPLQLAAPGRPEITSFRQGQAVAGQHISEGAISWIGDAQLYDVWLGRRDADGRLHREAYIRNVARRYVTLRELATAARQSETSFFSDLHSASGQLNSGRFEVFVRGVNGATDDQDNWVGRSQWSLSYDFSFQRVEGTDAVPSSFDWTNEIRPTLTWAAVPNAESYLLSFWKGPDYQNHRPVSLRVHGTQFVAEQSQVIGNNGVLSLTPGDEIYVRIRGIGSEGMLEGLRPGNFASGVVRIPDTLDASSLTAPEVTSPAGTQTESMPVLRWEHSDHAATYDVWFTSLQTKQRMFLATSVDRNWLYLSPESLAKDSDSATTDQSEYSAADGLADGRYRFWVRSRNPASESPGAWSTSREFTVARSRAIRSKLTEDQDVAATPLVAPNLIESYEADGRRFLLISNGLGESFGTSVLARYELRPDNSIARPVVTDAVTQKDMLEFADLPMGSNVTDMKFLHDGLLLVLSRGSNELRLVDIAAWKVLSVFDFRPGADGVIPDVMDLEILPNGQILVVSNRSSRLRIIAVDEGSQLTEVQVAGSTPQAQGFPLPDGRAMQVSGVEQTSDVYRLFLATPSVSGVVVYDYDAADGTMTPVYDQQRPVVVSRNRLAGPHIAGRLTTLPMANRSSATFYFSTDRNGFLTWIDVQSLRAGFIDLVDFLPEASRDASSGNYRNPNDASIDPSRILSVDDRHIAVLNNREQSVLLKLFVSPNGSLQVTDSAVLENGYGGVVLSAGEDLQVIQTAREVSDKSMGADLILSTVLKRGESADSWKPEPFVSTQLAVPVDDATVLSDNEVILEFPGQQRSIVSFDANERKLASVDLPTAYTAPNGIQYRDNGGRTAVHTSNVGRDYMAFRATLADAEEFDQFFIAIVDITDRTQPLLHSAHSIPANLQVRDLHIDESRIVLLDRLGGQLATLWSWQSETTSLSVYDFSSRHPARFGASRSGRIVFLPDGTQVVLHDTNPDRVFTVFKPSTATGDSSILTVHAHNAGQWINDMRVFDDDRVIAVTWDAKVIILNVKTGVFELVQQLGDPDSGDLNLYGVRNIDFRDGLLSVSSPAAGLTVQYEVTRLAAGNGFATSMVQVIRTPNVVTNLLTPSAQWAILPNSIVRIPHRT